MISIASIALIVAAPAAGAPAPGVSGPDPVTVQRPAPVADPAPERPGDPAGQPADEPIQDDPADAVPEPTGDAAGDPVPTPGVANSAASDPAATTPDPTGTPATDDAVTPAAPTTESFGDLLAVDPATEEASRPVSRPTAIADGADRDEILRRAYRKLYRPPHNPPRFQMTTRLAGGLMGGARIPGGGRYGGAVVDAGMTWNHVGFFFGGMLAGAAVRFDDLDAQAVMAVGGAAGLNLGRLAYARRALVNASLGYRITALPLGRIYADDPPPTGGPLVTHGPELRLDAGFLLHDPRARRFRHAVGLTLGHQVIVGVLGSAGPVFHASTVGAFYSFG